MAKSVQLTTANHRRLAGNSSAFGRSSHSIRRPDLLSVLAQSLCIAAAFLMVSPQADAQSPYSGWDSQAEPADVGGGLFEGVRVFGGSRDVESVRMPRQSSAPFLPEASRQIDGTFNLEGRTNSLSARYE